MLRPRINACLCPRQERSLWRCRSAWLMKALPRTGWEQLLVVAGGKLVAGAQWRWDGASYLLHTAEARPPGQELPLNMRRKGRKMRDMGKRENIKDFSCQPPHIYIWSQVSTQKSISNQNGKIAPNIFALQNLTPQWWVAVRAVGAPESLELSAKKRSAGNFHNLWVSRFHVQKMTLNDHTEAAMCYGPRQDWDKNAWSFILEF